MVVKGSGSILVCFPQQSHSEDSCIETYVSHLRNGFSVQTLTTVSPKGAPMGFPCGGPWLSAISASIADRRASRTSTGEPSRCPEAGSVPHDWSHALLLVVTRKPAALSDGSHRTEPRFFAPRPSPQVPRPVGQPQPKPCPPPASYRSGAPIGAPLGARPCGGRTGCGGYHQRDHDRSVGVG